MIYQLGMFCMFSMEDLMMVIELNLTCPQMDPSWNSPSLKHGSNFIGFGEITTLGLLNSAMKV